MIAIPILCAAFALTCVVQVTDGAAVAYGLTCTASDTCSVTGTTCRAATTGGTTTCLCDTTKYMVKASTTDTCECDTGYTGSVPTCSGKVGSTCAANGECIANAYCGSDKKCACKPTHTGASGATTCVVLAVGGTCTASGGECGALSNAYCNTGATAPACACATIYTTGTPCAAKSCTAGGTECTSVDSNSQCISLTCGCKTNYGIFTTGTKATCQPGVGAACTSSGGECANLPGGYCNVAVCACGAIYTAAAAPACTTKVCEPGSTTCSTADSNSECGKGYCVCKSGMSIGSDGKCQGSGATAVIVSMLLLIASLLAGRMM